MPDRGRPAATRPRPHHPLWWFHRHLHEDQFTDMVGAIVDTEIDLAGDRAATSADTEYLYLDGPARAALITRATTTAEETLRHQATAAVEHYVAAKKAHTEQQRRHHIDTHGCGPDCNTIRPLDRR